MTAEADFTRQLVEATPELALLLDEHLAEQEGELLAYLFMGDVARWLHEMSSTMPGRIGEVLGWLEARYTSGDFDIRNLIDVGIIEMLPARPEGTRILTMLPAELRARAEVAGLLGAEAPPSRRCRRNPDRKVRGGGAWSTGARSSASAIRSPRSRHGCRSW